ncbi:MAG: hypothetical protein HOW73_14520 [Polyangiaceae bacterium]|nr:hypothetical protein [Polyangiaceae bacterium]
MQPIRRTSNAPPTLRTTWPSFLLSLIVSAAALAGAGCPSQSAARPEITEAATSALALSDALEKLITEGRDTQEDRDAAYELVQTLPTETAGDAFGRAAIAGRLAEKKGALSVLGDDSPTSLVAEAEEYARKSRKLDPEFRLGAATRMLGTLYVMAPANLLQGGNSEDGIEILEHLVATHPEVIDNHLRLAEGYIALGDKDSAKKPLCIAINGRASLRKNDGALLDKLAKEVEGLDCKATEAPPSDASAPTSQGATTPGTSSGAPPDGAPASPAP